MKVSIKDIYIAFFLLGIQLLGGGYVLVPLMTKSLIEKRKWITEEELADFYALSQSLPGILAANISCFTGYKLRGKCGAFAALSGIITSPVVSIILIAEVIDKLLKISFIQSIFWGVGIAVIILVYLTVKEMWKFSLTDGLSWIIFLTAFLLSFFFRVSPVHIIIFSVVIGVLIKLLQPIFFKQKGGQK
ncbi:chromate transporter [bacterium]|nr:chromate transporter [bacterium]